MDKQTLKALFALFKDRFDSDLWNFFVNQDHRLIDKWVHYFPIYEEWFGRYRNRDDLVFCEIGVFKGGSVQMWKNYFGKNAKIIGVDIDRNCKQFEDEQISIEIGDQADVNFWNEFKAKYPRIDILLDDGGHTMQQQIVTFQQMFPHISDGGLYMCEDCHTSYWNDYGGGLKKADSFIEFSKNLIDEMNALHTRDAVPISYNTMNMYGLHFYDSIVIAEKKLRMLVPFGMQI